MTRPLDVTIVRPKLRWPHAVGSIVGGLIALAIRAWIVMLLAPIVFRPVSYWFAAAACLVVGSLRGGDTSYRIWSREARS